MRILHVISEAEDRPSSRRAERVAAALARLEETENVAQRVAVKRGAARRDRLEAAGLGVSELPFRRWLDLRTPRLLRNEIGIFHADLVLAWDAGAARSLPPGTGGALLVGVVADYGPLAPLQDCDQLLAPTGDIAGYIDERGWPTELCHRVPLFARDEVAVPLSASAFRLPADSVMLAALPVAPDDRGLTVLLQALRQLPEVVLWLPVEEGRTRRRLRRAAADLGVLGRIRCVAPGAGYTPTLAAAVAVVACASDDPLGIDVLDAWVQSRPLVAAGSLGPAGLVKPGESGLLAPVDDPVALAGAIRELLDDPLLYDRVAAGGRSAYEAEYGEARGVERWLTVLRRLAGEPDPAEQAAAEAAPHTDIEV